MWLALAAGLAAAGSVCRADAPPSPEWRTVVAKKFVYSPPARTAQAPALPASFPILRPNAEPGLVEMAPVEVRAQPIYRELRQDFALQEAAAKSADMHRRLGIGYEGVKVGPVAVGFVTVFHVPVMFLGGMSW